MCFLLLLLSVLFCFFDEFLESMLVALNSFIMLKKYFKLIVILLQESKSFSVLSFNMISQFRCHDILRVVRTIFKLLNSVLSYDHTKFFFFKKIFILVDIGIKIFKVNCVYIYIWSSFFSIFNLAWITCNNRQMMEHRIPNLINQTLWVLSISIGLPLVDINIVELYPDSYTPSLALINVNWAWHVILDIIIHIPISLNNIVKTIVLNSHDIL